MQSIMIVKNLIISSSSEFGEMNIKTNGIKKMILGFLMTLMD